MFDIDCLFLVDNLVLEATGRSTVSSRIRLAGVMGEMSSACLFFDVGEMLDCAISIVLYCLTLGDCSKSDSRLSTSLLYLTN